MKKKFKLFATIGSLALAICMMTIGVLAAAQVSLTVDSTVSFSASSVYVQVDGNVSGGTQAAAQTFSVKNYTGSTAGATSPGNFVNVDDDSEVTSNKITFTEINYSESKKIVTYTFTVTNKGAVPAFVKIESTDPTNSAITVEELTKDASSTSTTATFDGKVALAKNQTLVVTYKLTLNNVSASVADNNTVSFSFEFDDQALAQQAG